jgi:hypothetical protein
VLVWPPVFLLLGEQGWWLVAGASVLGFLDYYYSSSGGESSSSISFGN